VIGVPDARFGEEVMAWVVPREGAEVGQASVAAFCDGRIAHYKVPRYVETVSEFPMTVTGKVQKYRLREMAIEALGLEEAAGVRTA
jgi:fatty-acyl-CoA synthase